jgi:hypothetical protein
VSSIRATHDLSRRKIEPSTAQRIKAEIEAGVRCGGCKRRIETGLEFTQFDFWQIKGAFAMSTHRTYACGREDCNYHIVAGREAHMMKPVSYRWLPESAMNPRERPSVLDPLVLAHVMKDGPLSPAQIAEREPDLEADHLTASLQRLVADEKLTPRGPAASGGEEPTFEMKVVADVEEAKSDGE